MRIARLAYCFLLSLLCSCTSGISQDQRDTLTYEKMRTREVSFSLRRRFDEIIDAYPEARGRFYYDLYIAQFLRLKRLLEEEAFVFNDTLDAYIGDLIHSLNRTLQPPVDDPIFLITRTPIANAHALGFGIIEIDYGLFRIIGKQEELAFILAHELAHEYFEHLNRTIDTTAALFEQRKLQSQLRRTFAGDTISEGARELRQRIYSRQSFSRNNEYLADSLAFVMMRNSGFHPAHAQAALQALYHHTESDSMLPAHVQSLFTFDSLSFDSSWWKPVAKIKTPKVLSFFSRDSLSTHPPFADRLSMVKQHLEELNISMLPEHATSTEDPVLENLRRRSNRYSFNMLGQFSSPYICLYESLRWLRKAPEDSSALQMTAHSLYNLFIFKITNDIRVVGPRPHPDYPEDLNALLSFLQNISKKSLGQICLQFHVRVKDLLPQLLYDARLKTLQQELVTPQSYEEWRLDVQKRRQAKRKQRQSKKQ